MVVSISLKRLIGIVNVSSFAGTSGRADGSSMPRKHLRPPEPIMRTLQNAALCGVDVRVMIPYRGDKGVLPPWASRSYIKDALSAGIKIYLYRKGYMHAKTLVIDDSLVTIGSTNIDFRGFEQDFEINAFMYDEILACQQRDIFLTDQKDAQPVTLEDWEKRPRWDRIKESFARIFSQVL